MLCIMGFNSISHHWFSYTSVLNVVCLTFDGFFFIFKNVVYRPEFMFVGISPHFSTAHAQLYSLMVGVALDCHSDGWSRQTCSVESLWKRRYRVPSPAQTTKVTSDRWYELRQTHNASPCCWVSMIFDDVCVQWASISVHTIQVGEKTGPS